jgi:hypothetical protein
LDNPGCACGFECENVFHFFLECPNNEYIRNILFLILQIYGGIDIDIILYVNENLTEAHNVDITFYEKRQNRFYKVEGKKKELVKVTPATINQIYDYYV